MKAQNLLFLLLCILIFQACTETDPVNEAEIESEIESEVDTENESEVDEETESEVDVEEESENEENPILDGSDYLYFVTGKINGEEFIYGQKVNDETPRFQLVTNSPLEEVTCANSEDQGLDYKLSYSTTVYPSLNTEATQPSFSIDFNRFYRCSDAQSSSEVFNTLFPIDDYEYSADDALSGTMRQIGMWYSPSAVGDKSYKSYGHAQSNSTFRITASETMNSTLAYLQQVEGEFSVTLVNPSDSSDTLEITDGKFKITVFK